MVPASADRRGRRAGVSLTDVSAAVHAVADGVALDVEIVPGASKAAFPSGFNPWRKRLEARVTAPPVEGRANAALVGLVAEFFGVPARDVRIVAGASGRQKRVLVVGRTRDEALARLGLQF